MKPCPFCGNKGCAPTKNGDWGWVYVYCHCCLANGPAHDDLDKAIAAWNRRAPASEGEQK
nr:Lar family restriction alleviation protein [Burkholderia vietnamiensis]